MCGYETNTELNFTIGVYGKPVLHPASGKVFLRLVGTVCRDLLCEPGGRHLYSTYSGDRRIEHFGCVRRTVFLSEFAGEFC